MTKKKLLSISIFMLFLNSNAQIVINEINYKDALDFETKDWIELYNNGGSSVDISNWVFKDNDDLHEFVIPNGTIMQSSSYLVLVQSLADFQALFPAVSPVIGDFEFGLGGGGELIRLFNDNEVLVDFVEYDDEDPWPTEPDGNGPTLELISPNYDNNVATSWAASIPPDGVHGTPGDINSASLLGIEDINTTSISIYPNPLITDTTIIISNENSSLELVIFDMLGREVKRVKSNSNRSIIEREDLKAGIYILKLTSDGDSVYHTQKLIVK